MWMISHPIRLAFLLFVVTGIEVSRSHAEQSELLGARMPYTAFDALPKTQLEVGGAKLDVAFAPGAFVLPKQKMLAWVERSATAVSVYYGRFPVPEARILIVPVPGKGVRRGTAKLGQLLKSNTAKPATWHDPTRSAKCSSRRTYRSPRIKVSCRRKCGEEGQSTSGCARLRLV